MVHIRALVTNLTQKNGCSLPKKFFFFLKDFSPISTPTIKLSYPEVGGHVHAREKISATKGNRLIDRVFFNDFPRTSFSKNGCYVHFG